MEELERSPLHEEFLKKSNISAENLSQMMKDNVYQTILYGIPFRLADEYAYSTKRYRYNDPRRLTGAVCEAYLNKLSQGHTYLHKISDDTKNINGRTVIMRGNSIHGSMTRILSNSSNLFKEQYKLLEWYEQKDGNVVPRVNKHLYYSTLTRMNDIKLFNRKIFEYSEHNGQKILRHLPSFWSEYQICYRIISLLLEDSTLKTSKDAAEINALELGADSEQAIAISEVFDSKVSIITGYAGTGKSRTVEILVELLLKENSDLNIKICAPTGIAAQNLQERLLSHKSEQVRDYFSDVENKCRTIHSLLEIIPASSLGIVRTKYSFNKEPLQADVVIIDETSMVDIFLMRSLLWAIPNHVHLVLVGDSNQLNSVGPGEVLYDLTAGLERLQKKDLITILPKWTKLRNVHRNEEQSRLPFLSKTLLIEDVEERWKYFKEELERCIVRGDAHYNQSENIKDIINLTVDHYLRNSDIALLTTRHEQEVGRIVLNEEIQKRLMHYLGFKKDVIIIQNRNDYLHGIFNGEKGIITSTDENNITAEFYGKRIVTISKEQANSDWLIGYATTVHKSQGSEAETVLLPIWTEPKSKIWNRSLLYTALTRGKDKVILVGKDEAIESAVKNRGGYRSTMLPLLYRNIAKKKAK